MTLLARKHVGNVVVALVALVLLAAGAFWLRARLRAEANPGPPNILIISLCSVRADHMSCYGYPRETTPNFERLAREAIIFDHAITQWPKTVPGFTAIMTGKYGHTTGVMRVTPFQHLDDRHETLAETLGAHGYETGAFISTPVLNPQTNVLQGFETVEEVYRLRRDLSYIAATQRAIRWLQQPREAPFFAWVHYNNAHQPYYPVGVWPRMFVDDEFYDATRRWIPVNEEPLRLDLPPMRHPYAEQVNRPDIGGVHRSAVLKQNPNELAYYIAQYDASIRSADEMAGDVLEEARRLGLLDNTIVVVVGDHGESLGDHDYYFAHGRLPYNDCARVPLLIRPAGGTKATRVRVPVAVFGLAPTLLELAGIQPPAEMEATSLLPVVHGDETAPLVFMESGYQLDYTLSVWEGRWKLIHIPSPIDRLWTKGSEYELYNLERDPGELRNLYETRPAVATRLRQKLEQWSAPWIEAAYNTVGTSNVQLDEEMRERLRALGYLP